jgi:hypothetical protein
MRPIANSAAKFCHLIAAILIAQFIRGGDNGTNRRCDDELFEATWWLKTSSRYRFGLDLSHTLDWFAVSCRRSCSQWRMAAPDFYASPPTWVE